MGNLSKNFSDHELLPPEIYNNKYPNKWFINRLQVAFLQFVKDWFVKAMVGVMFMTKGGTRKKVTNVLIVVNNWKTGGKKKYSGFRPPNCTTGGRLSQHRFKDGVDWETILIFEDGTREELSANMVREEIIDNEKVFMEQGLTTLESGKFAPGWTHADFRWTDLDHILIVGG